MNEEAAFLRAIAAQPDEQIVCWVARGSFISYSDNVQYGGDTGHVA